MNVERYVQPADGVIFGITPKIRLKLAASRRAETAVHKAADAHEDRIALAVAYAFKFAQKVAKTNRDPDVLASFVKDRLLDKLPGILHETLIAGGQAAAGLLSPMLKAAGDYEGHPFHGNQYTDATGLIAKHGLSDLHARAGSPAIRFHTPEESKGAEGTYFVGTHSIAYEPESNAHVVAHELGHALDANLQGKDAFESDTADFSKAFREDKKNLDPWAKREDQYRHTRKEVFADAVAHVTTGKSATNVPADFSKRYPKSIGYVKDLLNRRGAEAFHGAEFDESKHPRDDKGQFTDGGNDRSHGKPGYVTGDDSPAGLPPGAETEDGAEQLFNAKLDELRAGGNLTFYHEAPGDVVASMKQNGIRGGYGIFASINEPSGFATGEDKTVVEFQVPKDRAFVGPDMIYGWSENLGPYQMALKSAPADLKGLFVSITPSHGQGNQVPPSWFTSVKFVGKRQAGDYEGHPFHGNQYTGVSPEKMPSYRGDAKKIDVEHVLGRPHEVPRNVVESEHEAIQNIEIAKLTPIQSYVSRVGVEQHVAGIKLPIPGLSTEDPIRVVHVDGKHYIDDGHHRVIAAISKGETHIKARIIEATRVRRQLEAFRAAKPSRFTKFRFDAGDKAAAEWALKHAGDLAKNISDVTRERIKAAVATQAETGEESFDEIKAAIGDDDRAQLIARTESMTAANEGQRQAWQQAESQGLLDGALREWIATEEACPECDDLDGATTDLDGQYPGDGGDGPPLHPNCRCTEGITFDRG